MFLRVMKFPKEQEAGIVQSYLKGTALAWYMQKIDKLESAGLPVPASWEQLLPLLNERFEHRNPELAARDKLMTLRQGTMTLHQFLKEFEGCYAYIPRWDEADKIHRFLYGLKPHLRAKFCVDPATHSWWTSFDNLVSYITSYMSDDMSHTDATSKALAAFGEIANEIGGGEIRSAGAARHTKRNFYKKKSNGNGLNAGDIAKLKRTLNALTRGGVQKPSNKGRGPAGSPKPWTNGKGDPLPVRSKGVIGFCHRSEPKLCLGCYQPGHQVAECTAAVVQGVPEGYAASR